MDGIFTYMLATYNQLLCIGVTIHSPNSSEYRGRIVILIYQLN